MKKMKVISSLFIAAFLCFGIASCGNKTAKSVKTTDSTKVVDSDSVSNDSVVNDSITHVNAVK